jgi:hypothetical protein
MTEEESLKVVTTAQQVIPFEASHSLSNVDHPTYSCSSINDDSCCCSCRKSLDATYSSANLEERLCSRSSTYDASSVILENVVVVDDDGQTKAKAGEASTPTRQPF